MLLIIIQRPSKIFESGGYTYEGAEQPSWGGCGRGSPSHSVENLFFIFKNLKVTSDTY